MRELYETNVVIQHEQCKTPVSPGDIHDTKNSSEYNEEIYGQSTVESDFNTQAAIGNTTPRFMCSEDLLPFVDLNYG
jgi:hypothetical protein